MPRFVTESGYIVNASERHEFFITCWKMLNKPNLRNEDDEISETELEDDQYEELIFNVIQSKLKDKNTRIFPSGSITAGMLYAGLNVSPRCQALSKNELFDTDSQGRTLLHYAVLGERERQTTARIELIDFLIAQGLNVAATDYEGKTVLHYALATSTFNYAIAAYLIKLGIGLHMKDRHGKTPLHYAVTKQLDLIETLLRMGSNPNACDNQNATPLHYVLTNNLDAQTIIKLLYGYGADINAQDKSGETLLYKTLSDGWCTDLHFFNLLIKLGASLHIPFYELRTPLNIALRNYPRDSPVIKFLLTKGAGIGTTLVNRRTDFKDMIIIGGKFKQDFVHNLPDFANAITSVAQFKVKVAQFSFAELCAFEKICSEGALSHSFHVRKLKEFLIQEIDYQRSIRQEFVNAVITLVQGGRQTSSPFSTLPIEIFFKIFNSLTSAYFAENLQALLCVTLIIENFRQAKWETYFRGEIDSAHLSTFRNLWVSEDRTPGYTIKKTEFMQKNNNVRLFKSRNDDPRSLVLKEMYNSGPKPQ